MPLYVYACNNCGSTEDRMVPVDERDRLNLECCHQPMRRKILAPALSFVGLDFTRGYVPAGKEE